MEVCSLMKYLVHLLYVLKHSFVIEAIKITILLLPLLKVDIEEPVPFFFHSFIPLTKCIQHIWRRKWQPTLYSCLGNPIDRVWAWWAAVHGVAKSRTWLSNWAHSAYTTCQAFCKVSGIPFSIKYILAPS